MTTAEKGEAFRALHEGEPFVIPNPWDAGSARVLEALGFRALATTSSGFAFTLGRLDGDVTLDEVCAHVEAIARVSFAEAANQGDSGLAAVIYTIVNRLVDGRWGSTVDGVLNAGK